MTHDVFVSYAQSDGQAARMLTARLEAGGLRCWMAPRDVAPAADWAQEILNAITAARTMVLVFSASSNSSAHVRREVERAIHRDIAILTFRVEDVLPTGSLEYFLSTQHWLDAFPPPLEPHCQRLCEHLARLLGGAAGEGSQTAVHFGEADLHPIELALAAYVGPVAKYMVRQISHRTATLAGLIRLLASEIDSETDRRAFIHSCQSLTDSR
jgi:hypothetical protein